MVHTEESGINTWIAWGRLSWPYITCSPTPVEDREAKGRRYDTPLSLDGHNGSYGTIADSSCWGPF